MMGPAAQRQTLGGGRCQHSAGAPGLGAARWRTPVAVAVTPGISDGRMTEITGGDLQAGMQVITDQKTAAP
jgi:multidrug efflux pump subunit AcrA (membrane-fusion protein)